MKPQDPAGHLPSHKGPHYSVVTIAHTDVIRTTTPASTPIIERGHTSDQNSGIFRLIIQPDIGHQGSLAPTSAPHTQVTITGTTKIETPQPHDSTHPHRGDRLTSTDSVNQLRIKIRVSPQDQSTSFSTLTTVNYIAGKGTPATHTSQTPDHQRTPPTEGTGPSRTDAVTRKRVYPSQTIS